MTENTTGQVEVELKGDVHSAQYTLADGQVTVHYKGASRSAEVGADDPEEVARMLLSAIVRGV